MSYNIILTCNKILNSSKFYKSISSIFINTLSIIVENKIIEDIKAGNQEAFQQLVEQNQDRIINTCYGFVRNSEDADDITQDVFIEVYRSINKFNKDSKLSTWIYRIAVNKSLDFIKKQNRIKRWGGIIKQTTNEHEEQDNWYAHDETPEQELEQKERIRILNTAIDKLPTKQKSAFTLHKYEDLSYKEIAEIMETSVSSVESLMHRAKKNLQKSLEKYYKNEIF